MFSINNLTNIALVFFGAGIGGVLRFLFISFTKSIIGHPFPFSTLGVNIVGGFFIGAIASIFMKTPAPYLMNFMIVGILGGFTTFSSFSLDCVKMIQAGDFMSLGLYIGSSVIISIIAVFMGIAFIKNFI